MASRSAQWKWKAPKSKAMDDMVAGEQSRLSSRPQFNPKRFMSQMAQSMRSFRSGLDKHKGSDINGFFLKFQTQMMALIQDRAPEKRFTAVLLIKNYMEGDRAAKFLPGADQLAIFPDLDSLVRNILSTLERKQSPNLRKLSIITLTRIFQLAYKNPTIRQGILPRLPDLIIACLPPKEVMMTTSSYKDEEYLEVVFQSISGLMFLYPTTFRPFLATLQFLAYPAIAPTPSSTKGHHPLFHQSHSIREQARRLVALLHMTAPENKKVAAWNDALQELVSALHATANLVFRALREEWTSIYSPPNVEIPLHGEVTESHVVISRPEGVLPAWAGIAAGIERLEGLLHTISSYIKTATAIFLSCPMDGVVQMVERIMCAVPPSSQSSERIREEISRDEREGLFSSLPDLHVAAMQLEYTILCRYGESFAGATTPFLFHISWVYDQERDIPVIREASYNLAAQTIKLLGTRVPKHQTDPLVRLFHDCCNDLLPPHSTNLSSSHTKAAAALLLALISIAYTLPPQLRAQLDRTAILTNNSDAMMASTVNQHVNIIGKDGTSILPYLARQIPQTPGVDAFLHPQMPVFRPELDQIASEPEASGYPGLETMSPTRLESPAPAEPALPKRVRSPSPDSISPPAQRRRFEKPVAGPSQQLGAPLAVAPGVGGGEGMSGLVSGSDSEDSALPELEIPGSSEGESDEEDEEDKEDSAR